MPYLEAYLARTAGFHCNFNYGSGASEPPRRAAKNIHLDI